MKNEEWGTENMRWQIKKFQNIRNCFDFFCRKPKNKLIFAPAKENAKIAQLVEHNLAPNHGHGKTRPWQDGSQITTVYAKIAQLVEHYLAKVGVAGSSPVFRSKVCVRRPDGGMVDTKDLKSFGFTAVRVQVPLRVHSCFKSFF